jgi:hypothetical protein
VLVEGWRRPTARGASLRRLLFLIVDARKTLVRINAEAGTTVQGRGLRATFASIAELVSGGVLKRMMNHAVGGDVTLRHYVGKSEAQLRAGWQTVADFMDAVAANSRAPIAPNSSKARTRRRPCAQHRAIPHQGALIYSVYRRRWHVPNRA